MMYAFVYQLLQYIDKPTIHTPSLQYLSHSGICTQSHCVSIRLFYSIFVVVRPHVLSHSFALILATHSQARASPMQIFRLNLVRKHSLAWHKTLMSIHVFVLCCVRCMGSLRCVLYGKQQQQQRRRRRHQHQPMIWNCCDIAAIVGASTYIRTEQMNNIHMSKLFLICQILFLLSLWL